MEDRVDGDAEAGIAVVAVMPMLVFGCAIRTAVRANRLAVPSDVFEVDDAIFFGRKLLVDLDDVHGYPLLGRLKE